MAAMGTQEADDQADDDCVADYRARAEAKLDQIAQQAKQALEEHGIDTPVFFTVPRSGDSILTFGTITDPSDDLWEQVREIVSKIVRQMVGLDRVRCREVTCATTADQPSPLISPANLASMPQPIPAPLATDAGSERR